MKIDDLKFEHDKDYPFGRTWLISCIFNEWKYEDELPDGTKYKDALFKVLDEATDTENFIDIFLSDERFSGSQGWMELMKLEREDMVVPYLKNEFATHGCFATISDAGGVKVGNDGFSTVFQNGVGDGTTLVAIYESEKEFKLGGLLKFDTAINCTEAYVYDYDCGGDPVKKLFGRYGVYGGYQFVAFVKWN